MADINPNDSATLTDDLEIDSYDDVVNLFGADEAAAMLADVVGNRFNRQEILKAIRSGGDILMPRMLPRQSNRGSARGASGVSPTSTANASAAT